MQEYDLWKIVRSAEHRGSHIAVLYNFSVADGTPIVLPAKSDSGIMFCFQNNQGQILDGSLVY